jgi:teichuronic acid biosynthesis protein TuaE
MKFNLKEISKYLIIAATINIAVSYGKIYLFHIVLVPFLLFIIFNKKILVDVISKIKTISFYHFFAIIFIWYAISILWSADKIASIYYLAYITMGISIVLAFKFAANNSSNQLKILKILGIIFIIEIIISLLEGLTSFRYPISPYSDLIEYFGRSIGYNKDLPINIIEGIKKTPTGFRWNPNDLATTMLIILPFFIFHHKLLIKIAGIISIIVVIFLTGSRAVYFSLIFIAIGYLTLYLTKKQLLKHLIVILSLSAIIFGGLKLFKTDYSTRITDISTTIETARVFISENHETVNDTSSITIRQNLIKNGITALKNTYGVGVGGGNSNRIHTQKAMRNTHKITSMHNFWIEILVEGGVLIFIISLAWYFTVFFKLYIISKRSNDTDILYFAKAGSLSMIGFFIGVISLSSAIYFFPMWLLFGFNLATIYNYKNSLV